MTHLPPGIIPILPDNITHIFQGGLLTDIFKILQSYFMPRADPVGNILLGLTLVPRFDMAIMFLDVAEKQLVAEVLQVLQLLFQSPCHRCSNLFCSGHIRMTR